MKFYFCLLNIVIINSVLCVDADLENKEDDSSSVEYFINYDYPEEYSWMKDVPDSLYPGGFLYVSGGDEVSESIQDRTIDDVPEIKENESNVSLDTDTNPSGDLEALMNVYKQYLHNKILNKYYNENDYSNKNEENNNFKENNNNEMDGKSNNNDNDNNEINNNKSNGLENNNDNNNEDGNNNISSNINNILDNTNNNERNDNDMYNNELEDNNKESDDNNKIELDHKDISNYGNFKLEENNNDLILVPENIANIVNMPDDQMESLKSLESFDKLKSQMSDLKIVEIKSDSIVYVLSFDSLNQKKENTYYSNANAEYMVRTSSSTRGAVLIVGIMFMVLGSFFMIFIVRLRARNYKSKENMSKCPEYESLPVQDV